MLPLFPLQIVVFPGEPVNLHIFEPRYRQMIQECDANGTTFGIAAFIGEKVMDLGTEMELLSVEKRYEKGEMDIKTRGIGLFRVERIHKKAPGKLYPGAEISPVENGMDGDPQLAPLLLDKLRELFQHIEVEKELPDNPLSVKSYDYAHLVGFSLAQEYAFLNILDEAERQHFLLEHLETILPTLLEIEEIRRKAQMNGHFKNLIPPF